VILVENPDAGYGALAGDGVAITVDTSPHTGRFE
jgi:hypothetical protein